MKTLSKIATFVLAIVVMTSCVSKKKYDEAMAAAAAEKSALESSLAAANAENDKLQADAAKLQDDLNMSKEEIATLGKTVAANNERISNLENSIRETFEDYGDGVSIGERNGKLYISLANSIVFDAGRARIAKDSDEILAKLAGVINANDGLAISIEGHTDTDPVKIHKAKYGDNWALSSARAVAILRALVENGVDEGRLFATGKGSTEPVASNETDEGKEQNRRTEFVVMPQIDGLYKLYKSELASGGSK